jgi:hypothetical protein
VRFGGSVYYYNLHNFVYTAFTGATDPSSNLPIVNYAQVNSRFVGTEASIYPSEGCKYLVAKWQSGLRESGTYRTQQVVAANTASSRHAGTRLAFKAFSVRPEMILLARQNRVFDNETSTAGYGLFNLNTSYTFVTGRLAHIVSLSGQNLTDKLYRNHLSTVTGTLIKSDFLKT